MKVIDLLQRIANGEEVPKKIHYNCVPLYWCEPCKIYETMTDDELCGKDLYTLLDNLNDEVEIIEEKKIPEKLDLYEETQNIIRENNYKLVYHDIHKCIVSLECKYNEIIDYLESKGDE